MLSLRGRKRTTTDSHVEEGENADPGMRGMEMLAESARRVSEEEERRRSDTEHDSKEGSPGKTGLGLLGGPKYPCQYCAKTFSRPSSLRIHTYSRECRSRVVMSALTELQILANALMSVPSRRVADAFRSSQTSSVMPKSIRWDKAARHSRNCRPRLSAVHPDQEAISGIYHCRMAHPNLAHPLPGTHRIQAM